MPISTHNSCCQQKAVQPHCACNWGRESSPHREKEEKEIPRIRRGGGGEERGGRREGVGGKWGRIGRIARQ